MGSLVSVIVPTYNNEKTIERCIHSILNQTLREIELIVINDGSTDNTKDILESIAEKDERVKVIHKHNEGQGISRNVGMKLATGKYIGFVDGDDTIDKDMYKVMFEKAVRSDADVVQCNIIDIFEDGRHIIQLPKFNKTVIIKNRKEYFNEYIFKARHSAECCNKLIKRSFLAEHNVTFESNAKVFSEDLLFNLDMALQMKKIVFIENLFYHYYQYEGSHSKYNSIDKVYKLCVLFEIFYKRAPAYKKEISKIAVLIIMINLSHILHTKEGYEKARELIVRKDIKEYLFLSLLSTKKIRHKIIMLLLLYLPVRLKLMIVGFYYTHLK